MTITLPDTVSTGDTIAASWGAAVRTALSDLDSNKAELSGCTFTGDVKLSKTWAEFVIQDSESTTASNFAGTIGFLLSNDTTYIGEIGFPSSTSYLEIKSFGTGVKILDTNFVLDLYNTGMTSYVDLDMNDNNIILGTGKIGYDATHGMVFDASGNATFDGGITVANAEPYLILKDSDATTITNYKGYVDFKVASGTSICYLGITLDTSDWFRLYHTGTAVGVYANSNLELEITDTYSKFKDEVRFENDDNFKIYNDGVSSNIIEFDVGDRFYYNTSEDYYYIRANDTTRMKIGDTIQMVTSVNMLSNNINNAVIGDFTETATEGAIKWDSTNHKLLIYNGSAWETVTSTT